MTVADSQFRDTTGVSLNIPMFEFVAMMASLLALNALAIDTMLPALEHIGEFYERQDPNDQQLVIFAYIFGFGFPQLFFGPLSDRFGRKGLLQICLAGFSVMAVLCMVSTGFWALLAFRFCQGVFAAGVRVIAGAVIRDLTSGRTMARIMSLVFTVFMIVPIIAPGVGTLVMVFGDWKWTFGVLGLAGMAVFFWTLFRLPYTLPEDMRQPLNVKHISASYLAVLKTRVALGYMLASGIVFGALFAFIGASEQVFDEVFGKGDRFWIWFAVIASGIAVANITNARLVERLGMRRISHTVLLSFIVLAMTNLVVMKFTDQNFWLFLPLFTLMFGCFGMMGANFSSIALEPLGKIAGTASAAYGFATTTLSAWLGWFIARQFDGTVFPILVGFAVLGLTALLVVLWTEKGKLFEIGLKNKGRPI